MTFFFFLCCAAVALGPYWAAYKLTGLEDRQPRIRTVIYTYIGASALRMMAEAALFPLVGALVSPDDALLASLVRFFFDLADVVGLHLAVRSVSVDDRIAAGAVVWGGVDAFASRVIPLFFTARAATAIDAASLQSAASAGAALLHFGALSALLFLAERRTPPSARPLAVALIAALRLGGVVAAAAVAAGAIGSGWPVVALRAVWDAAMAVAAIALVRTTGRAAPGVAAAAAATTANGKASGGKAKRR